jgi:hypothetical protein
MQKCIKCGAKGTQNASFCSVCGAVFGPLAVIPDNPKSFIAIALAAMGFLICGPFTGIPAFLMARSILAGPVSPPRRGTRQAGLVAQFGRLCHLVFDDHFLRSCHRFRVELGLSPELRTC